jgi:transposase
MDALHRAQSKKNAEAEKAIIVHEDEATFRQTPTLHQTWALRNSQPRIPTKGQRNSQKILGAVCPATGQFAYRHQTEYFTADTYISFLDEVLLPAFYKRRHRVYLIQDNASYHKKPEVYDWFAANRKRIEVYLLPPYSPELNATEKVWWYTRKEATHNKYFDTPEELCQSLFSTFHTIQENPAPLVSLVRAFP